MGLTGSVCSDHAAINTAFSLAHGFFCTGHTLVGYSFSLFIALYHKHKVDVSLLVVQTLSSTQSSLPKLLPVKKNQAPFQALFLFDQ